MRRAVAETVVKTLSQLDLPAPELSDKDRALLAKARAELEAKS
jgi:hypothetical protein